MSKQTKYIYMMRRKTPKDPKEYDLNWGSYILYVTMEEANRLSKKIWKHVTYAEARKCFRLETLRKLREHSVSPHDKKQEPNPNCSNYQFFVNKVRWEDNKIIRNGIGWNRGDFPDDQLDRYLIAMPPDANVINHPDNNWDRKPYDWIVEHFCPYHIEQAVSNYYHKENEENEEERKQKLKESLKQHHAIDWDTVSRVQQLYELFLDVRVKTVAKEISDTFAVLKEVLKDTIEIKEAQKDIQVELHEMKQRLEQINTKQCDYNTKLVITEDYARRTWEIISDKDAKRKEDEEIEAKEREIPKSYDEIGSENHYMFRFIKRGQISRVGIMAILANETGSDGGNNPRMFPEQVLASGSGWINFEAMRPEAVNFDPTYDMIVQTHLESYTNGYGLTYWMYVTPYLMPGQDKGFSKI